MSVSVNRQTGSTGVVILRFPLRALTGDTLDGSYLAGSYPAGS